MTTGIVAVIDRLSKGWFQSPRVCVCRFLISFPLGNLFLFLLLCPLSRLLYQKVLNSPPAIKICRVRITLGLCPTRTNEDRNGFIVWLTKWIREPFYFYASYISRFSCYFFFFFIDVSYLYSFDKYTWNISW